MFSSIQIPGTSSLIVKESHRIDLLKPSYTQQAKHYGNAIVASLYTEFIRIGSVHDSQLLISLYTKKHFT